MKDDQSMIRIERLCKEFGGILALDGLSIEVKRGEFFAFLGPNAAGKTTTIRIMTGLLEPTSGSVIIGGHDIQTGSSEAKKIIGYVPDIPYLYGKLTVGEFAEFVMAIYGLDLNAGRRGVLDAFGLKRYMADLIILDEPFVGLDPKTAVLVKRTLSQRVLGGATVFMSTHTLAVAEELAGRIAIMDGGKLIAVGTTRELSLASGSDGRLEDTFMRLTEEKTSLSNNQ